MDGVDAVIPHFLMVSHESVWVEEGLCAYRGVVPDCKWIDCGVINVCQGFEHVVLSSAEVDGFSVGGLMEQFGGLNVLRSTAREYCRHLRS